MTTELRPELSKFDTPASVDGLRARAILKSGDLQKLSYVRHTDTRTALARGLKEYLEHKTINWVGGRLLRFEAFKVVWAEPEEPAKYPSAALVGEGPAGYQDSEFTPRLVKLTEEAGDGSGRHLRQVAELQQNFSLQLWATDPVERQGLVAMVEDALEPAEFMTGLRLELPYYFNVRATYEKLSLTYEDSETAAHRRSRKALVMVVGSLPQMVPAGDIPTFEEHPTRVDVQVT
jgi:hypothetical protein